MVNFYISTQDEQVLKKSLHEPVIEGVYLHAVRLQISHDKII
jgi:hypothetical protein